ncbi:DNA mismatch repair protein MSH4 [Tanacetum coccineum]
MNRSWKSDLCNDSTVASEPKVRLKRKKEEVGCVEDKQRMDAVKEKAIEAIMRYCDSLYFKENIIEEKLNGIQGPRVPSKYEFESLIRFIEMVSEREIIDEYKELVKNHFGRMVQWFHKDYMEGEERPIPARINGVKVSLLDLYLTVKGLGGHTQVIMKNNWIEVAYAMGFPKEYVSELEECYGTHLSLLGAYYEGARNYSSGMDVPKAREREGTSGIMAMELPSEETRQGHIGTKARLVDDEEGMIGKVELDDGENATNKKIKKEDELKTLPSITLGGPVQRFYNLKDANSFLLGNTYKSVCENEKYASIKQCFTVKAGIDGFLDIARRSFCDTSEAIHNLANMYRKEFKLPNLKIPFNNRHGFYFNIPQQVHSGSKGDMYHVLKKGKEWEKEKKRKSKGSVGLHVLEMHERKRKLIMNHVLKLEEKEKELV